MSDHVPYDQSVGAPDPGPGPDEGASIADLLSRLGDDVTALFRQEVELAKVEMKQEATRAAKAGAMFGAAAVVGLVTLSLVAWTIAWAIALVLPTWAGFLITAVLFGAVAAVLAADDAEERAARDRVHDAKVALGERGLRWWRRDPADAEVVERTERAARVLRRAGVSGEELVADVVAVTSTSPSRVRRTLDLG